MHFNLTMSISMEQSLKAIRDRIHLYYIFGVQKSKKSTFFFLEKHFYQYEVGVFTNWFR